MRMGSTSSPPTVLSSAAPSSSSLRSYPHSRALDPSAQHVQSVNPFSLPHRADGGTVFFDFLDPHGLFARVLDLLYRYRKPFFQANAHICTCTALPQGLGLSPSLLVYTSILVLPQMCVRVASGYRCANSSSKLCTCPSHMPAPLIFLSHPLVLGCLVPPTPR